MAARARHGDGSIHQRADGKWVARIEAGYTPRGTRRRATRITRTKQEAVRALRDLKTRAAAGETHLDTRTTVKAWSDEWLPLQEARVRPKGFRADKSAVRQWIVPTIGHRRLTDLTPADTRKLETALEKAGRAGSTIIRVRATLSTMLKAAIQEGHNVPQRVIDAPVLARAQSSRGAIPLDHAVALLKAAADTPVPSRWAAALLQGMRQAECLGLAWDRINWQQEVVYIDRQLAELAYTHGCGGTCGRKRAAYCPRRGFSTPRGYVHEHIEGRFHLVEPKTMSGVRVAPLLPWMRDALQDQQRRARRGARLVWENPDGTVRDSAQDTAEWKALQDAAGVRHETGRYYELHECRHTAATLLLSLGVDPVVMTRILGHSTIASSQAYMHADLSMVRAALEGAADRLGIGATVTDRVVESRVG